MLSSNKKITLFPHWSFFVANVSRKTKKKPRHHKIIFTLCFLNIWNISIIITKNIKILMVNIKGKNKWIIIIINFLLIKSCLPVNDDCQILQYQNDWYIDYMIQNLIFFKWRWWKLSIIKNYFLKGQIPLIFSKKSKITLLSYESKNGPAYLPLSGNVATMHTHTHIKPTLISSIVFFTDSLISSSFKVHGQSIIISTLLIVFFLLIKLIIFTHIHTRRDTQLLIDRLIWWLW